MIDAKDLKLGNWIEYENTYYEVYSIYFENGQMQPYRVLLDGIRSRMGVAVRELQPIPLTPSILVNACGFRKGEEWDYLQGSILLHDMTDINESFEAYTNRQKRNASFLCEIKYLHQLQNLYYALTGEEIPIDITKLKTEKTNQP